MKADRQTVLDHVITWNRNKLKKAKDPKDQARYQENIDNLIAFKEQESVNTNP